LGENQTLVNFTKVAREEETDETLEEAQEATQEVNDQE
jgi:hypothetical protein